MKSKVADTNERNELKSHPSYGTAVVLRSEGGSGNLFMSGVTHHQRVTLEIRHARMVRAQGFASVYPEEPIVRVDFSELQWGQLMARMGQAQGTPCTITRINNKSVEPCPPDKTFEDLAINAKRVARKAMLAVKALEPKVDAFLAAAEGRATTGKRELVLFLRELSRDLASAREQVEENMPWVATAIQEHAEGLVEDAKRLISRAAEVEAARLGVASQAVQARLGEGNLRAAGDLPNFEQLEERGDNHDPVAQGPGHVVD